jgi:hypothetical protein
VLACSFLLSFTAAAQHNVSNKRNDESVLGTHFKLLPLPRKVEVLQGKPLSISELKSVHLEGLNKKPVLDQPLSELKSAPSSCKEVLTLRLTNDAAVPKSKEGYIMEIKDGQVIINARDEAGLFYGCKTLSQLMQDAIDQDIKIPSCKITDYPDVDYRAIHLDLKHHLDSASYYYRLMDRLADVKINAVIIEFEDKLKYESAPVVGASHAISIEDFAAISKYAKDRNIEISPLVQGLGHASFILKHPEYKELRDDTTSDWSFDPLNPKTYDLQFSLYKDAMAATPYGKYLHVGGDEVGKLGMSELAKKSGMKPLQLQMYWLKKVCDFASEHNRVPIFWDDMVFKLSDLYETTYDPSISQEEVERKWKEKERVLNEKADLFPKNCVYMRWNYDNPTLPGNKKALKWYKSHSLAVMAATSGQQIWPMMPRANSNFQPVKDFSRITADNKLNGILLTLWDDTSPHFETYWRGIYDFALFNWNYKDITKEEAHSMFRHRFFGPQLSDPYFEFEDTLEQAITFWDTALINNGSRENYPEKINMLDLPNPNTLGNWTKMNRERLLSAHKEIDRYNSTREKIAKALKVATRNKYALEVFKQINELQIYPAKLLVSLEKYDEAKSPADKSQAAKNVRNYADSFSDIRRKYETVMTRSRVLHNPADYLPDQNHHRHLANGTLNSDWMYVYELAFNEKIMKEF